MKIGQLANIVGCTVEAVRFYEKQGLIEPAKRTIGNFRVYTEEHLKQLSFICYCRSLDISLKESKCCSILNVPLKSKKEKLMSC